jgi:hypothetical protein
VAEGSKTLHAAQTAAAASQGEPDSMAANLEQLIVTVKTSGLEKLPAKLLVVILTASISHSEKFGRVPALFGFMRNTITLSFNPVTAA